METGGCQKPSFAGEWVIVLIFVRGMVIIFVSACSYSNGRANNEFLFGKKRWVLLPPCPCETENTSFLQHYSYLF